MDFEKDRKQFEIIQVREPKETNAKELATMMSNMCKNLSD